MVPKTNFICLSHEKTPYCSKLKVNTPCDWCHLTPSSSSTPTSAALRRWPEVGLRSPCPQRLPKAIYTRINMLGNFWEGTDLNSYGSVGYRHPGLHPTQSCEGRGHLNSNHGSQWERKASMTLWVGPWAHSMYWCCFYIWCKGRINVSYAFNSVP